MGDTRPEVRGRETAGCLTSWGRRGVLLKRTLQLGVSSPGGRGSRGGGQPRPGVPVLRSTQLPANGLEDSTLGFDRTPLLISELFMGLSEEITGLSSTFQRKHLVKTSKPERMLLALRGLPTGLRTDSASVHPRGSFFRKGYFFMF